MLFNYCKTSWLMQPNRVTRLGYFRKGLGDKLSYKSSLKIWQLLGLFEKGHLLRQTYYG